MIGERDSEIKSLKEKVARLTDEMNNSSSSSSSRIMELENVSLSIQRNHNRLILIVDETEDRRV